MRNLALVHSERHQFSACLLSDAGGFQFVGKITKRAGFATNMNLGNPLSRAVIPMDTSVGRRRAALAWNVLSIPLAGYWPKIGSMIVQPISVDVVATYAVSGNESQNVSVQVCTPASPIASRIGDDIAVGRQRPRPSSGDALIRDVNEGVRSNAAVSGSQGDTYRILIAHRANSSVSRPRTALTVAGVSCVNYTREGRAPTCQ